MGRILPALLLTAAFAHPADNLSFEVAAIRAADPQERRGPYRPCTGGPGTSAPGSWTCTSETLSGLIFTAYDLNLYEFEPPGWMSNTRFAIVAKVPPATTREQFHKMQQNLLAERFKLAMHRQPKEKTIYELVVGKSGLKMHESAPDAPVAVVDWSIIQPVKIGEDKYPVFPDGRNGMMGINGRIRWRSSNVAIADLVRVLKQQVETDVVDRTGLTGKYDIDIYWQQRPIEVLPAARPYEGPDIEKVLQDRLGLRLAAKKGTVEVVVIDHAEKTPVEN